VQFVVDCVDATEVEVLGLVSRRFPDVTDISHDRDHCGMDFHVAHGCWLEAG